MSTAEVARRATVGGRVPGWNRSGHEGGADGSGRDGRRWAQMGAKTRIDRRDFGLMWNQTLETGGILVGNEVRIEIEAQAVPQNGNG